MHVEKRVSFVEVLAVFCAENALCADLNAYAAGLIRIADVQFGHWILATLSLNEILNIMLPHHHHSGDDELVPPCCLTVADAINRLDLLPSQGPCRKRIEAFYSKPPSAIFLSMGPVNGSGPSDYGELARRTYKGLTHIDGLHRLVAWGKLRTPSVSAYVAEVVHDTRLTA